MQRNNCTVLSFGINHEWGFEDDMAAMGCTVHAFDPTMNLEDYKRSDNVYFYNLGLGDGRAKRKIGMDDDIDYFHVDSYEHILEQLGLLDVPIHYLKMDIELSELEFLRDALRNSPHLLQNVRQLAIEVHHGMKGEGVHKQVPMAGELSPTSTFPLFWQHFQELHCLGFRLIYSQANLPWHEVLWGRPV
ncbi:hypothetical protein Pcinc_012097 [Petrolisthes cinctipes]|uniref:Methyltransferase domain-containing protein n=1 Tax=Petrolisthes cinctipes TaxID=88211 RepID=A0AAE1G1D3_PETCI|nr:hypothetical protein Pcinc_012097 [Petrolisthes cinctipes]